MHRISVKESEAPLINAQGNGFCREHYIKPACEQVRNKGYDIAEYYYSDNAFISLKEVFDTKDEIRGKLKNGTTVVVHNWILANYVRDLIAHEVIQKSLGINKIDMTSYHIHKKNGTSDKYIQKLRTEHGIYGKSSEQVERDIVSNIKNMVSDAYVKNGVPLPAEKIYIVTDHKKDYEKMMHIEKAVSSVPAGKIHPKYKIILALKKGYEENHDNVPFENKARPEEIIVSELAAEFIKIIESRGIRNVHSEKNLETTIHSIQ